MLALHIIVSSVLLLLGFLLIITLLKLLFAGMLGNYRVWTDRRRLGKNEELMARADELVSGGELQKASELLQAAFFLEQIPAGMDLVERSHNLHLAILGRLLNIADQKAVHLGNIALVEDLLHSRYGMTKMLLEKGASLRTLKRQSGKDGKSLAWALAEFKSQIEELKAKLAVNAGNLRSQITILMKDLWSQQSSDEVTYH